MAERPDLSRRDALCALAGAGALSLPPQVAAAAAPRRGGGIRVATISSSTADTLDPAKGALSTDHVRHFMVYSGLTQFTDSLTPRLALAESIESSDRVRWSVHLRKGVAFHDGSPLTPADVVYSLLRHKTPALGSKVKTMQTLVHDRGGVAIPVFISNLDAHAQGLNGLRPIPMMGYSFAEYVWLEG
jgi:peptide/nickel transport system substrate-binding protein